MDKKVKYQSSNLLLDMIRKEYKYDENEFHALSGRTGITLAVIGVYILILLQFIPPVGKEQVLFIQGLGAVNLSGIIYCVSIAFALVAVYQLMRLLLGEGYQRVDLNLGFDENHGKKAKDRVAMDLVYVYREVCDKNAKGLKKKNGYYTAAIKLFIASMVFLMIYFALVFIVMK